MGLVVLAVVISVLTSLFVFFQLSMEHGRVKRQRTLLYDSILREHHYWHRCKGGLSVNRNGSISHFRAGQGGDYDAERNIPSSEQPSDSVRPNGVYRGNAGPYNG